VNRHTDLRGGVKETTAYAPRLDIGAESRYNNRMLTAYIRAAMGRARYEMLPDDGSYYGEVPGFQGVYANAGTLEGCREELESTLEDWILRNLVLPEVGGLTLQIAEVA
jgi:hypothetical protein